MALHRYPRGLNAGDPGRYCEPVGPAENGKRTGCILSALHNQLAAIVSGERADRGRALRYVIHFIGHLHMPLHVSDNGDYGGNCVPVRFGAPLGTTNLHALWDSGILDAALSERHLTEQEFTRGLDSRYLRRFDEWTGPEPSIEQWAWEAEQWAWEAHKLASDVTYGKLTPPVPVEPSDMATDCAAETAKLSALNIVIGKDYQNAAMASSRRLLAPAIALRHY